jgi:hypothetical protein
MDSEETVRLIRELANALFVTDRQLAAMLETIHAEGWEAVHRANAVLYERAEAHLKTRLVEDRPEERSGKVKTIPGQVEKDPGKAEVEEARASCR